MQIINEKNTIDMRKENALFRIQVKPFSVKGDINVINSRSGYLYLSMEFECFGEIHPFEYQVWCNNSDRLWHKKDELKWIKLENGEKKIIEQTDYNLSKDGSNYTLYVDNGNFDLRLEMNIIEKTIDYEFFLHLGIPAEYHIKEIIYSEKPIKYHEPIFDPIDLLNQSE